MAMAHTITAASKAAATAKAAADQQARAAAKVSAAATTPATTLAVPAATGSTSSTQTAGLLSTPTTTQNLTQFNSTPKTVTAGTGSTSTSTPLTAGTLTGGYQAPDGKTYIGNVTANATTGAVVPSTLKATNDVQATAAAIPAGSISDAKYAADLANRGTNISSLLTKNSDTYSFKINPNLGVDLSGTDLKDAANLIGTYTVGGKTYFIGTDGATYDDNGKKGTAYFDPSKGAVISGKSKLSWADPTKAQYYGADSIINFYKAGDTLEGGEGNDTITGGLGNDTIQGGSTSQSTINDIVTASQTPEYTANFNSQVDAGTETIEGRIENLLAENNPVIRQAGDRAMAAFAGRGLLNSSMAIEAANEAMIAKAIEIAGPDAEKYFQNRTNNVNWQNKFAGEDQSYAHNVGLKQLDQIYTQQNLDKQFAQTLQTNYLASVSKFESEYNAAVNSIQASEMSAQDKTAMIAQMTTLRDNNVRLVTNAFENMPDWSKEWSSLTSKLPTGISEKPAIDLASGPTKATNNQLADAIEYAAKDPSFMDDATFNLWAKEALNRGLITQNDYNDAIGTTGLLAA